MAATTVRATAARIAEHAAAHRLAGVQIVLHGGEPLLLGVTGLDETLGILRATVDPVTRLDLRMQSNGVLLTAAVADVLARHDVRVGISLDGDQAANDRHRRYASGAGSHPQVLRALELLRRPEYRRQYAGILCTIDVRNDPIAVYRALLAERPPRIDLLLPHATWDTPPLRPDGQPAPYAHWLLAIYDRWVADGRPMPIRIFDSLRSLAAGGPSQSEWVGLDPVDLVVVETDGTFEQVDTLKTAFDGAAYTGLTVFDQTVDEVAALPELVRRTTGIDDLHDTCRTCRVVEQCGGGLYAHRYREGAGFSNPSVYCADLLELIVSMNDRIATARQDGVASADAADLPPDLIEQIGSGRGDAAAVGYLAQAQLAIGRALTAAVAQSGSTRAKLGLDVLADLDVSAPGATRLVLSHPYVRVWAVEALRQAAFGQLDAGDYLGNIAAAVAVRGGEQRELAVSVQGGAIHLPTVGTVRLAQPLTGVADLSIADDQLSITLGADELSLSLSDPSVQSGVSFEPSRWASAGAASILIEDLDPFRDCHDWKADGRLAPAAAARWQELIARAWQVIGIEAPHQVPAMTTALKAVVPLSADPTGPLRSSTARHAFGSVAVAVADPAAVAVMLVHEFQHTILGALLDLVDLFDLAFPKLLTVAWRPDPRPIEGVLQGTYAHLAVADMWRARAEGRTAAGTDTISGNAADNYRQYVDWTAAAIDTLIASGGLTPAGLRFVDSMAATMAGWSR